MRYQIKSKLLKYKDNYEEDMIHYDNIKSGIKIGNGEFVIVADKCTRDRWESFGFVVGEVW